MRARWLSTDRHDGDFSGRVDRPELISRCRSLVDAPWTLLNQVHGDDVVTVTEPGGCSGATADAVVTACRGAVLGIRTADCAAVVVVGRDRDQAPGVVGLAHAGWKGLEAGVLQRTVEIVEELGALSVEWYLAPCISAAEYEFGEEDLTRLAVRYGPGLVSVTRSGSPALDMFAAVTAAMDECGAKHAGSIPGGERHGGTEWIARISNRVAGGSTPVPGHEPLPGAPLCTASDDRYYSWRARHESGRQVTAVWLEDEDRPVPGRAVQRADGVTN